MLLLPFMSGRFLIIIYVIGQVHLRARGVARRIRLTEHSNDILKNQTHDPPTYSTVSQPTTLPYVLHMSLCLTENVEFSLSGQWSRHNTASRQFCIQATEHEVYYLVGCDSRNGHTAPSNQLQVGNMQMCSACFTYPLARKLEKILSPKHQQTTIKNNKIHHILHCHHYGNLRYKSIELTDKRLDHTSYLCDSM